METSIESLEQPQKLELDLREVRVFGWEKTKYSERLNMIRELIKGNYSLPRVHLTTLDFKEFDLMPYRFIGIDNIADGGHHRVLAHYLEGRNLPVIIYNQESTIEKSFRFDIRETKIVSFSDFLDEMF